ncbi:AraC family transcriptional regulator [Curtobacterium sp. ISL-83]|uniref:AraC family transcriptional regulator n=1 Tax=Curtobacterium sp. ISL-83 TaxID=2819145 RepID=UPI001BE9C249|nr:AraC family transcriptional regulator [Curtobacterium sp. ISL-83]MBT2503857.1 AraC family transcriptional regulator [Curtobacterium sp. ISL-83]
MDGGFRQESLSGRVSEFRGWLGTVYGQRVDVRCDERLELRWAGNDRVATVRLRIDRHGTGSLEPRADHMVIWTNDGSVTITDSTGAVRTASAGNPVVVSACTPVDFAIRTGLVLALHVSDAWLQTRAALAGRPLPELVEFGQADAVPGCAERLGRLLDEVVAPVASRDTTAEDRSALDVRVAEVLLDVLPVRNAVGGGLGSVDTASRYARDHAASVVLTSDMSGAAGISDRTLQQAFQDELGETPLAYLRRYRLERIRHDLLAGDGESVGEVARRWGIGHLGRFAAVYAVAFGEMPSDTLTQGRRRLEGAATDALRRRDGASIGAPAQPSDTV